MKTGLTASVDNRDHPANEVYVTGTFDDWAKSVRLEKKGNIFEKLVVLSQAEENIYYKVGPFSLASIVTPGLLRNAMLYGSSKTGVVNLCLICVN